MTRWIMPLGIVVLFASVSLAEPPQVEPAPKPTVRDGEQFGLKFYYAGDQSVKEFLRSTPCVSGIWWKCNREDENHYIGELHYPTENTADYEAEEPGKRSPQYYMVMDIAIRKQSGLPIDLKTFRGALVLRDPKPSKPLSVQGDGTSYELVGYEVVKDGKFGFLFSQQKDLKFTPPKDKE